jgi:zinc protease
LKVVIAEDGRDPFVDVELRYAAGAKDDPIGRAGLAHLVEHLMFQGTRHLRSGDLDRLFRAAGADDRRAATTADETTYWVRLPAEAISWSEKEPSR